MVGLLTIVLGLVAIVIGVLTFPAGVEAGNPKHASGSGFLVLAGVLGIVMGISFWRGTRRARRHARRLPASRGGTLRRPDKH
jgi:hypothetical protein